MQRKFPLLVLLISFFFPLSIHAQDLKKAGDYMEYIGKEHRKTMEDYMAYASSVAHSKSAKKMETKRKELIATVNGAINRIKAMPPFNGDKTYKDSSLAFFKLYSQVLNEDYTNIVNLEEIAEESYDAMEAYWEAQDQANTKLENASDRLGDLQEVFAEANGINLIHSKDELKSKLQEAGKVHGYYRKIYLIFFKALKQEAYLLDAGNMKDISGMEQNISSLAKVSAEGILKLDSMATFKGDKTLKDACKQYLVFTGDASKLKYPVLIDFLVKEDQWIKTKEAFDKIPQAKRTKADIDSFNKGVNEYNAAVNKSNTNNNALNTSRSRSVDNWNKVSQDFLNRHVPKYQ